MADDSIPAPSLAANPFHGTREDAKAEGAVRYINGIPCGRGHSPTIRLTSNTQCVTCRDMKQAELKALKKLQRPEQRAAEITVGNLQVYVGSRTQAEAAGAKYYINERRLCPRGHSPSIRLTSNTCCIGCHADWAAANAAAVKEQRAAFREENRDRLCEDLRERYRRNPERYKAAAKKNALENPERNRATNAAWRLAHKEYMAAYYDAWRRANPDKAAAKAHKRRAAKLGSTEHFTAADIQEIFALQRGRCACCRAKLKAVEARDHIVALARGGNNGRRNIQITCQPCNSRKGARDPIDFMRAEFGRLL